MKKTLIASLVALSLSVPVMAGERVLLIYWRNYKTGNVEMYAKGALPADRAREFIPQAHAAQDFYTLRLSQGKTPEESVASVLQSAHGRLPDRTK